MVRDQANERDLELETNIDPDPDEDNASEIQDPTQFDLDVENYKLICTKWKEGMTRKPAIGGVHLGKVPLYAKETFQESSLDQVLVLETARKGMQFQSGQVYIPVFKRLSMKTGMMNLEDLGSLPAMVTNLMLPSIIHKSTSKELERVEDLIMTLENVRNNMKQEIDLCRGNNCIRLEFYFSSKFDSDQMDWKFPDLVPWNFCSVSDQNSFFTAYTSIMEEVMNGLTTSLVGKNSTTTFDAIPTSAKKMLILCSEMAVSMTEIFPFFPKTLNQIREAINNEEDEGSEDEESMNNLDPDKIMFHIPESMLDPLDSQTELLTGLKNGLKADTLFLPEWDDEQTTERLSPTDLGDRKKDYIQVYLNGSTDKVKLMNHYVFITGKFLSLLFHHQDKKSDAEHTNRSILELPDFSVLATLDKEDKISIVKEAAKMIANTYDFEWWWIVKQRLSRFASQRPNLLSAPNIGGPDAFPTTVKEVKEFLSDHRNLGASMDQKKAINTVGKISHFSRFSKITISIIIFPSLSSCNMPVSNNDFYLIKFSKHMISIFGLIDLSTLNHILDQLVFNLKMCAND